MTVTITLPWPDKRLSQNARGHWATKEKARKLAKDIGFYAALAAGVRQISFATSLVHQVTFIPPRAGVIDLDNLIARTKYHRDGIALAIGIDDSKWTWAAPVIAKPEKPGRVVVTLTLVGVAS